MILKRVACSLITLIFSLLSVSNLRFSSSLTDLWKAAVLADQIIANPEAFQFTGKVFQCAVQFTRLTARRAPHHQSHLTGCSWFWWPWPWPAPGSCSTAVTPLPSSLLNERSFVHKKGQYYKNPPYRCEPWRSWWFFDRCRPAIARANKQYKLIVNKILENCIEKRHCEISIPRKRRWLLSVYRLSWLPQEGDWIGLLLGLRGHTEATGLVRGYLAKEDRLWDILLTILIFYIIVMLNLIWFLS